MNTIIVFSAIVAMALAQPQRGVSLSQDTVGNYNLKYNTDDATRSEQGFQDGKVVGSFSFKDKEGGSHTIQYVAAPNGGFTAQGDIPRQVSETPEVAAVRASHLAIVARERALLPPLREEQPSPVFVPAPAPVQFVNFAPAPVQTTVLIDNTAQIEAEKAEHFAAHQRALSSLADAYRKAPVVSAF